MVLVLLLWALAVGLLCFALPPLLRARAAVPLTSLDPDALEGAYVRYEVPYIYAAYLQEQESHDGVRTGANTGGGYLIDVQYSGGRYFFLGLYVHGSAVAEAEALFERSLRSGTPEPFAVEGTVRPLAGEETKSYEAAADALARAFAEDDAMLLETYRAHFLPCCIDAGRVDGRPLSLLRVLFALGLLALLGGLGALALALASRPFRLLREELAALGGSEALDALLEDFYAETAPIGGVRVGYDFVLLPGPVLLPPWELVWAYGEGGYCVLRTLDGRRYDLPVRRGGTLQALLDEIQQLLPGTVVGWTERAERLYMEDRAAFAAAWERARPGCYQEKF